MREFLLRGKTKWAGVYPIYENQEELRKYFPDAVVHKWAINDVRELKAGEYIQAEDGYVIPILYTKDLVNKYGQITYLVRVPMGTFGCYLRKDGTIRYPRLYAQFTVGHKSAISDKTSFDMGNKFYEKVRFVRLLIAGMDHFEAYRMAFRVKTYLTPFQINSKVTKMLGDSMVVDIFREELELFKGNIEKKFNNDMILQHLEDLMDKSEKGSAAHRGNIKFIMELRGLINNKEPEAPGNMPKGKSIQDIPYEEEPAPQLDSK